MSDYHRDIAIAADGESSVFPWRAGAITLALTGVTVNGSVDVEVSFDDGTTWTTLHTFSADGVQSFPYLGQCKIKAVTTGSTTPSMTLFIR